MSACPELVSASMRLRAALALACLSLAVILQAQSRPAARASVSPGKPNFSGEWILNRELSDEQPGDDRAAETDRSRGRFGGVGGRGGFGRRGGFGGAYGRGRGGTSQSTDE